MKVLNSGLRNLDSGIWTQIMSKPNILVVEDEELMRSILRQLLEEEGYHVFTANSAETALEIFPTIEVDVTLTDIKMSGMDGLELLSQIRAVDEEAMVGAHHRAC